MVTLNLICSAMPQETGDERVEGMYQNAMSVGLVSWGVGGITDTQIREKDDFRLGWSL